MRFPYYIIRTIKHAIDWFFEDEEEKIWCRSDSELRDNLKSGDKIFALNTSSGEYVQADSIEHAYHILDNPNRAIYDLMDKRYCYRAGEDMDKYRLYEELVNDLFPKNVSN